MELKKYIRENRIVFVGALFFSFACFSYMLVNPGISIDEETWIQIEKPFAMWLVQGRWGIDVLNFILQDHWRYAPVLWDILAIVIWNGAGILLSYTFFGKEVCRVPLFFFQSYFCSLPFVLGEMFSFSMFSFQIAVGMLSVAAAFWKSVLAVESGCKKEWIQALLFLVFAFSIYQSYVCVYITAVGAYSLKTYMKKEKNLVKDICAWAVLCIIGIGIYYLVHIILMNIVGTTSYLTDNYVGWFDEGGLIKTLFLAIANIVRVLLSIPIAGEVIYGGEVIRVVTMAFIVLVVWSIIKEPGKRCGILFYSLLLAAAPFALFIVLGTYKTHGRVLLGLPLAGAMEIYLIISYLKQENLKKAAIILNAFILFLNAKNMNILFYSANVAYEHDRTIANQVMYDIKRQGYDYHNKPIVFLGMEEMDEVGLPVSDTVGSSIFEWDDGNILRMCNFIRTEGYAVKSPDTEAVNRALKYKDSMVVWPQQGSVAEEEDIIIVLLSEPSEKWYVINNAEKQK